MPEKDKLGMAVSRVRSVLQGRLTQDSQSLNTELTNMEVAVREAMRDHFAEGVAHGERRERERIAARPKHRPIKKFVDEVINELDQRARRAHRP